VGIVSTSEGSHGNQENGAPIEPDLHEPPAADDCVVHSYPLSSKVGILKNLYLFYLIGYLFIYKDYFWIEGSGHFLTQSSS